MPPLEDEAHEDHVDGHLEERIEDPPDLAEGRVRVRPLELRADEVARQPTTSEQLAEAGADEPEGGPVGRDEAWRGGRLDGGGAHGRP